MTDQERHEYVGRTDRRCDLCGMADRHPIHAARVAAPSDAPDYWHHSHTVTDATGTSTYTHPSSVCPYCVAARSDGLRAAAERFIARWDMGPPLPRNDLAMAVANLRAALATTEQREGLDTKSVAAAILDEMPEAVVRALPSGYEWAERIAARLRTSSHPAR